MLWRDLKDWLALSQPTTLDTLSPRPAAEALYGRGAPHPHGLLLSAHSNPPSPCTMLMKKPY